MITDLRLQKFRSYEDTSFELGAGVNIIVGPNASGKTNLLEAVLFLARGSSYRAKDIDLVKSGEPWARIDAHLAEGGQRSVKLVVEPAPSKSFEFNSKNYKRLTLPHTLPAILFEPNHLLLLSGGPERRREYLDDLLEQTLPGYGVTRRQYRRTLAQRNALLKQSNQASLRTSLFPWDVRLSQLAGRIVRARAELTDHINAEVGNLYRALSGAETKVTVVYDTPWEPGNYESQLLKKLETNQELDIRRGFTGNGPHREDMTVFFDGRESQETASRGEARTALLALKILELQTVEQTRGLAPILLLDDVFSELDGKRRHALTAHLKGHQSFITTTDADIALTNFGTNCNIIPLV
jgi:DNA replication and repair protein RecF